MFQQPPSSKGKALDQLISDKRLQVVLIQKCIVIKHRHHLLTMKIMTLPSCIQANCELLTLINTSMYSVECSAFYGKLVLCTVEQLFIR